MSLQDLFESAVHELKEQNIAFAVAGGFAANLYRADLRLTQDVDFVLLSSEKELEAAKALIEKLGLKVGVVREAELAGGPLFAIKSKSTKPYIVGGRPADNPRGPGIDILLNTFPWVEEATLRAQDHQVDFGFGKLPTLTVEDVIIAKLWALQASQIRAKDLDDLQSIGTGRPYQLDSIFL